MANISMCDICSKVIHQPNTPDDDWAGPSHICVGFRFYELCELCSKPLRRFLEQKGLETRSIFTEDDIEDKEEDD